MSKRTKSRLCSDTWSITIGDAVKYAKETLGDSWHSECGGFLNLGETRVSVVPEDMVGGNTRYWFSCPGCGRDSRKLFQPSKKDKFLCKHCHSLRSSVGGKWGEFNSLIREASDLIDSIKTRTSRDERERVLRRVSEIKATIKSSSYFTKKYNAIMERISQ